MIVGPNAVNFRPSHLSRGGSGVGERLTLLIHVGSARSNTPDEGRFWVQLPTWTCNLGGTACLVAPDCPTDWTPPFELIRTGFRPSVLTGVLEFPKLLSIIMTRRPRVFLFNEVRLPVCALAAVSRFLSRILSGRGVEKPTTHWILKLDWAGDRDSSTSTLGAFARAALISLNSLFVDTIIAESTCTLRALGRMQLVRREKIVLLQNGFPNNVLPLHRYTDSQREAVILTIGRFSQDKGQETLVRAFADTLDLVPGWKLRILGVVEDAGVYKRLKSLAAELGRGRVEILPNPPRSEIVRSYRSASIFCLPSLYESSGQVRIEAISQGLPIITSEAGCGSDFGAMGSLVVPTGRVDLFSRALGSLMTSPDLRREVAERQQAHVSSYQEVTHRLLRISGVLECTSNTCSLG